MKSSINTAYGIMIDHSPAIAEDVPTDGLAEAIASAIDAERERCALIAENAAFAMSPGPLYSAGFVAAKNFIASRIRGDG